MSRQQFGRILDIQNKQTKNESIIIYIDWYETIKLWYVCSSRSARPIGGAVVTQKPPNGAKFVLWAWDKKREMELQCYRLTNKNPWRDESRVFTFFHSGFKTIISGFPKRRICEEADSASMTKKNFSGYKIVSKWTEPWF